MKRIITVLVVMLFAAKGFAQSTVANPYPKTITVSGSAEMEVTPDEIYVLVDLKEYEKKGTKINLDKIKSDFLSYCKSIGLPDSVITIASYDGSNGNPWIRKKSKKAEQMMASITYQVKFSNSKKMDELVEKLDDEATQNFRIQRTSHSKIQEYRKQLKIQAVKAAKEKAGYLAAAIDEQIGAAVTINEPADAFTDAPFELSQMRMAGNVASYAGADAVSGPSVDFKKIKLRFEVNVVFALK